MCKTRTRSRALECDSSVGGSPGTVPIRLIESQCWNEIDANIIACKAMQYGNLMDAKINLHSKYSEFPCYLTEGKRSPKVGRYAQLLASCWEKRVLINRGERCNECCISQESVEV